MARKSRRRPEGQEAKTHWQVAKTHCPKGHEYTPENTKRIKSTKPGKFKRQCKQCKRDFEKRKAEAKKLEHSVSA